MASASSQSSKSCPSRYPRSCHNSKAFSAIHSLMPFGNSIDCGDAAKAERIEDFIFFVGFVALVITTTLANYGLLETFLPELPGPSFWLFTAMTGQCAF